MQALRVVLEDELPIGPHLVAHAVTDLETGETETREPMHHRREILVEGLGVVADVHEKKALAFGDRGGVQRKVAFVEPVDLMHVWRADEAPVGGVCPRVIRALNRLGELA